MSISNSVSMPFMGRSVNAGPSAVPLKPRAGEDLIPEKAKELTAYDFMKLVVFQLQNQNPLEPMSSSDMMGQISSLTSTRLSESLDLFSKSQNSALGQGMLGREVTLHTTDSFGQLQEVTGVVSAIEDMGKASCKIEVNGKYYSPSDVIRISNSSTSKHFIDANILGKNVTITADGQAVNGQVTAISNPHGDSAVQINGTWYKPNAIQAIYLKEEKEV